MNPNTGSGIAQGTRCAAVKVTGCGGVGAELVLLEHPADTDGPLVQTSRKPPLALFAVEAGDERGLIERLHELGSLAATWSSDDAHSLARAWWQKRRNDPLLPRGLAIVADRVDELKRAIAVVEKQVRGGGPEGTLSAGETAKVYYDPAAEAFGDRIAFVYPGLGSHFAGMGRELATFWPDVLRAHDTRTGFLRDQLDPSIWWNGELPRPFDDHRHPILGNVSVSCLVTDLLGRLRVTPRAAIGYSMGEASALVALRAWDNRDELHERLWSSSLFQTDLAGPCAAARRTWQLAENEGVDWIAGIVLAGADAVRAALAASERVYVLIVNSAFETVIGGQRGRVAELVKALGCPFIELSDVSTVHCEIGRTHRS